jgi:hypothetical protein
MDATSRKATESPSKHLLAKCRDAINADPWCRYQWRVIGSFGRGDAVWHGDIPVSDLDLVVLAPVLLEALPDQLSLVEERYRTVNPAFRLDVKQVLLRSLPDLAGTLLAYDLATSPILLSGSSKLNLPCEPPSDAAGHFLVANRYSAWLQLATADALAGKGPMWATLHLQHSTCNIILALTIAHMIRRGVYRGGLADRVPAIRQTFSKSPHWANAGEEALRLRALGRPGAVPPIEQWKLWEPVAREMLMSLTPSPSLSRTSLLASLSAWPAEAGAAGVQSVPRSGSHTPAAMKGALQASSIILAHCLSDSSLSGEFDLAAGSTLPGWVGGWEASRIALREAWRRKREGVE